MIGSRTVDCQRLRVVGLRRSTFCIFAFLATAFLPTSSLGQLLKTQLDEVSEVGIDEHLGEELPLTLRFTDSRGRDVQLNEYFDGARPVILSFNYSSCPLLCKLQLNGLVDCLRELEMNAGEAYRVVSISIDPSETHQQAAISQQKHLEAYGRAESGGGWSFLTGTSTSIASITRAAGFRYEFVEDQREFAHAACVIVCTPDGMISRYIYGVAFEPETMRLSLTEASGGKVGSSLDQLILFCFRYDSDAGAYTPAAWNIMRLGAVATTFLLCAFVIPYWLRSRHQPVVREANHVS